MKNLLPNRSNTHLKIQLLQLDCLLVNKVMQVLMCGSASNIIISKRETVISCKFTAASASSVATNHKEEEQTTVLKTFLVGNSFVCIF